MYLLDGIRVKYEVCVRRVVAALEDGDAVSYAYHRGADCYWLDREHPWYAQAVLLTDDGVVAGGRVLEGVIAS